MKITVKEAAEIMGVTPRYIHLGLQLGKFPFGTAIKIDKRWSYYINAERFRKYMAGEDLSPLKEASTCHTSSSTGNLTAIGSA